MYEHYLISTFLNKDQNNLTRSGITTSHLYAYSSGGSSTLQLSVLAEGLNPNSLSPESQVPI